MPTNVYIEGRPQRRPEGNPIEDYVVEDHVLATYKTQQEAIRWAQSQGHTPHVAAGSAPQRQANAGSLTEGLGAAASPHAGNRNFGIADHSLSTHYVGGQSIRLQALARGRTPLVRRSPASPKGIW